MRRSRHDFEAPSTFLGPSPPLPPPHQESPCTGERFLLLLLFVLFFLLSARQVLLALRRNESLPFLLHDVLPVADGPGVILSQYLLDEKHPESRQHAHTQRDQEEHARDERLVALLCASVFRARVRACVRGQRREKEGRTPSERRRATRAVEPCTEAGCCGVFTSVMHVHGLIHHNRTDGVSATDKLHRYSSSYPFKIDIVLRLAR